MWQLLIILFLGFGTTNVLLRRILAKELGEHNRLINAFFYVFFLFPAALILTFVFPHNLNIGIVNFLLLVFGSIIWPIAYILVFRANKIVDAGIIVIINNLNPLFTLAIATTLLNEVLDGPQLLGIGLLILSGILAASTFLKKQNRVSPQGIALCVLCAALFGVGIAYERFMLGSVDLGAFILYGWTAQVVWSILFARKDLRTLPRLFEKHAKKRMTLVAWGIANTLKSASFLVALKLSGSASIMSATTNFMAVAVVISAYFFLNEKDHMREKWLSAGIGIVGLFLITT